MAVQHVWTCLAMSCMELHCAEVLQCSDPHTLACTGQAFAHGRRADTPESMPQPMALVAGKLAPAGRTPSDGSPDSLQMRLDRAWRCMGSECVHPQLDW